MRILDRAPAADSVEEIRFDAIGDCLWVEFDDEGEIWRGVFGRGRLAAEKVVEGDREIAFVLAGGRGYLVDLPGRRLVLRTGVEDLHDVLAVPGSGLFVAADDHRLHGFSARGEAWKSRRVTMKGIELLGAGAGTVTGRVRSADALKDFTLVVGSWKFECPWVCPLE